ncbi:TRAP transporter small permease [Aestuariispira insulae]|uniref:TRAP transporter small permease protein n=1 Tax=Aestuariispira insulae TaxID=1461337 RepID=A0A3D9HN66_9PROT|nr:TRAP transporter small permease [Aestuariispira insulae]RED50845.1 C4-dicarboxylate transporter DctQ subunit [Aestuariispira insulae]
MSQKETFLGSVIDRLEEGVIALLFAAMTLVTFTQVVARYGFNSGAVWALELTTYLFAWMVLFGISYGVKKNAHLGVDAVVNLFGKKGQRTLGMIAVIASMVYAAILFYGGYEYVAKLFKIGIEAEDLPIPRWVPMVILPVGMALLFFRFSQVAWRILTGLQDGLVLGNEAADAMKEYLDRVAEEGAEERRKKQDPTGSV